MAIYDRTLQAFCPLLGPGQSTVGIDAGTATGNVALPQLPGINGTGEPTQSVDQATSFSIYNLGSVAAFVAFGGSAVTAAVPSGATPGGYCVPPSAPGLPTVISVAGNPGYMAAITGSSTAQLYVTPGYGKN